MKKTYLIIGGPIGILKKIEKENRLRISRHSLEVGYGEEDGEWEWVTKNEVEAPEVEAPEISKEDKIKVPSMAMNAKPAIEKINSIGSEEELKSFAEGDERATVKKAFEVKLNDLMLG